MRQYYDTAWEHLTRLDNRTWCTLVRGESIEFYVKFLEEKYLVKAHVMLEHKRYVAWHYVFPSGLGRYGQDCHHYSLMELVQVRSLT